MVGNTPTFRESRHTQESSNGGVVAAVRRDGARARQGALPFPERREERGMSSSDTATPAYVDVRIGGAGLSVIGAAYYPQRATR